MFKIYALFTDCISKINDTQINNIKYLDVIMQTYDVIEYSDNYADTSRGLY